MAEFFGLKVIVEGSNPCVDVVAVHGLGATPNWAWIRKMDEEKRVNWLADKDMLPAKLPNSRIMTFNYESKWLLGAPKQRRSLCAIQLLTALDNKRKEEKNTKHRPLIFIGHSFGGVVIEQALVSANAYYGSFHHLSLSTVGIIFLGTPHRGTNAAKWGSIVANSAKALGFGTEDSILKDLQEDSESSRDLLYDFTLWANRASLTILCFFEQHKTDYGQRFGWTWEELVVCETSACIDGYRKVPLATDHFKINKFSGPDDPSYLLVYPLIVDMAQSAVQVVSGRLNPQKIIEDNSRICDENLACLRSLFLSNPQDDLAAIHNGKGKRIAGTCAWILTQDQYTSWLFGESSQLLWLSGAPGIGKTMISSFLVEELTRLAERSSQVMLAYYFCDDKDEKRRTATSILRGLLLQLLRQRPSLFKHIQSDFSLSGDSLFTNFDALWKIFDCILKDPEAGEVYCLIDALDECEKESRGQFLTKLTELFCSQQSKKTTFKFILTSRRESDIVELLSASSPAIRNIQVDSGKVKSDLSRFIDNKVNELATKKGYEPQQKERIKRTLTEKAGGTFLYVSLVLHDLQKANRFRNAQQKLRELPPNLNDAYDRILGQIDADDEETAKSVFCWVAVARRPLTVKELAMTLALGDEEREGNMMPSSEFLDDFMDSFKCCEPLIYIDTGNDTINLIHQSAKDYLLGKHLQSKGDLSQYHIVPDSANLQIFQTCWAYLSLEEFKQGMELIMRDPIHRLHRRPISREFASDHCFLQYASQEWEEHALAASRALITGNEIKKDSLDRLPTFRDTWLHRVTSEGQEVIVQRLLENGAELESKDEYQQTPLSTAAGLGQEAMVKLLLQKGAEVDSRDNEGETPLSIAVRLRQKAVVELLLQKGAKVENNNVYEETPLWIAAKNGEEMVVELLCQKGAEVESYSAFGETPLSIAAENGREAVVKLLLQKGAEVEPKNRRGETPLFIAAKKGREAVVELLLQKGAEVESYSAFGETPLWIAAENGREAVVKLLLQNGAEVDPKDHNGRTPLNMAAQNGREAVVELLLQYGAEVDSKNDYDYGSTPLTYAAMNGHEAVVKLLLQNGAEVDPKDRHGRTPLWEAAQNGQEAVVRLLLEKDAEVDSKDDRGRTPLWVAAEYGREAVVKLLLQKGAEVDSRTPLWMAAKSGREAVVRLLLEKDVEVDSKDDWGRTPLWMAAENGQEAVVRLLLEKDAEVDSKDCWGRTPLWIATRNRQEAVVRLLLEKDAEVDSKNDDGRTPLWIATQFRQEAVVKLLLQNGAEPEPTISYS